MEKQRKAWTAPCVFHIVPNVITLGNSRKNDSKAAYIIKLFERLLSERDKNIFMSVSNIISHGGYIKTTSHVTLCSTIAKAAPSPEIRTVFGNNSLQDDNIFADVIANISACRKLERAAAFFPSASIMPAAQADLASRPRRKPTSGRCPQYW